MKRRGGREKLTLGSFDTPGVLKEAIVAVDILRSADTAAAARMPRAPALVNKADCILGFSSNNHTAKRQKQEMRNVDS
jgi:hypothetical protein